MIAYIKGTVGRVKTDHIVLECYGIGYQIFMSNPNEISVGSETLIHVYEHIREDVHTLFGFPNEEEHALFERLISVKGIGPKIAINVLSVGGSKRIVSAIESNDATYLKSLPGIGAKAASQIVLDLKGKLVQSDDGLDKVNTNLSDAMEALKSLGYKPNEINQVARVLSKEKEQTVDGYVKKALTLLLKQKGV